MSNVETSLQIAAEPARVWQALIDFDAWSQWNPIIPRIRADARVGGTVRFRIRVAGTPAIPITAKIVRFDEGRELAWRGGPPFAWGQHFFRVAPSGEGTLLTHGEEFGGLLGMLVSGSTKTRVERTYATLNRALRDRVEKG